MFLWIKKSSTYQEGEVVISFDPPCDEEDPEEWLMLTTREEHYKNISQELIKQAKVYNKQSDHRAERVAIDLAKTLENKKLDDTSIN